MDVADPVESEGGEHGGPAARVEPAVERPAAAGRELVGRIHDDRQQHVGALVAGVAEFGQ